WIDKKNGNYLRNTHYNFYRSSSDGNTIAKFHEKTDNKGANIVLIVLYFHLKITKILIQGRLEE
ncbi:hypothetical protein GLOIN_2v1724202, partial [Rhizophagus irregularis DAOM 181602=DAOM 197198]